MGYFVISPIIGHGGWYPPLVEGGPRPVWDPYRPKVADYGSFACIDNGVFALAWSEADPAIIDADITCLRIPDNRLDAGSINKNQADNINAQLAAAYGVPPLMTGGMSIRECINALGDYLQPGWTYTVMSVTP